MITPINSSQLNFTAQAVKSKSPDGKTEPNSRTSIFYINDFHGKSINMERTIAASNVFDSFTPSVPTDKLKLSSGDIQLGEPVPANKVMAVSYTHLVKMLVNLMKHWQECLFC